MNIGIISNSDDLIPLAYTLANQRLQVCVFFSPPADPFIYQKVTGFSQAANIPLAVEKDPEKDVYEWLTSQKPSIVFVLGYKYLLKVPAMPVFNIHYGPLPAYKGPVPVFWQLKEGRSSIGLSIHRLTEKFDDGEVVWSKETLNLPYYNYSLVHQVFSQLCVEGVGMILQGKFQQYERGVSRYLKKPQLADVMIDWQQMGASSVCDLIRACNPWNKGAQTNLYQQEVKLMDAVLVDGATTAAAGTILDDFCIATVDGKIIKVNMLYLNECFVPAYYAAAWGFEKGKKLGQ